MFHGAQVLRDLLNQYRPNLRGRFVVREKEASLELDINLYQLFGFNPSQLDFLNDHDLYPGEGEVVTKGSHQHYIVEVL